jgi:hypothetical protein
MPTSYGGADSSTTATSIVTQVMPLDRRRFLLAGGALVLAACGSSKSGSGKGTSATSGSGSGNSATSADGYDLAPRFARELVVPGTSRMPFSLAKDGALLSDGPDVLSGKIVDASNKVVIPQISAKRRQVTEGIVYWDFHPTLQTPGLYTLLIEGGTGEGGDIQVSDPADVTVPYPGQQLPPFDTPTTAAPKDVNPICTRLDGGPCPFHEITLTQALATGKPVAYLIGTPAHCQFGTCAPGLEFLITASKRIGAKMAFVHAEVYTDDTATVPTPAVQAYNLSGEPDLWLTDASGKIVTRFEGAWDQSELDETLDALLA